MTLLSTEELRGKIRLILGKSKIKGLMAAENIRKAFVCTDFEASVSDFGNEWLSGSFVCLFSLLFPFRFLKRTGIQDIYSMLVMLFF